MCFKSYYFVNRKYIIHGIIGVHRPPPKILGRPLSLGPPLDIKAPGPPLVYLVGLLAILDPCINICVGTANTCIALKQFNVLPPNIVLKQFHLLPPNTSV